MPIERSGNNDVKNTDLLTIPAIKAIQANKESGFHECWNFSGGIKSESNYSFASIQNIIIDTRIYLRSNPSWIKI
jgi:hypothetical protein